jgi:hypothetical protein
MPFELGDTRRQLLQLAAETRDSQERQDRENRKEEDQEGENQPNQFDHARSVPPAGGRARKGILLAVFVCDCSLPLS